MAVFEVDAKRLKENARAVRGRLLPGVKLCAMVKAEAYGHGLIQAAQALSTEADWYGVANVSEAERLRAGGVAQPLLLTGCAERDLSRAVDCRCTVTVSSARELEELQGAAASAGSVAEAHIKADTGMNRLGLKTLSELRYLLDRLNACPNVRITGVYTHFYSAASADAQYRKFLPFAALTQARCGRVLRHASASCGLLLSTEYQLDMVRAGILLYGYYPFRAESYPVEVRPAAKLYADVLEVKRVRRGETVSYDGAYVFPEDSAVAAVQIGYGDGVSRALGNRGKVELSGRLCPVRGRVCMDLLIVETGTLSVARGDRAYLIGDAHTADDLASEAGTISYEALAGLNARVERKYLS